MKYIAKISGHKIWFVGVFNPFLKLMSKNSYVNKVFGNMTIDNALSNYKEDYNRYSFEESINITEEII